MHIRVWWKETEGSWSPKPTGKRFSGIVVSADDSCLYVRRDDGKFTYVDADDEETFIRSEWVDRP